KITEHNFHQRDQLPSIIYNSLPAISKSGSNHNHSRLSPVNLVDGKALSTPSDATDQLQHLMRFETLQVCRLVIDCRVRSKIPGMSGATAILATRNPDT
ncbi:hypothetical protein L9F63_020120, partial [Diploptera punctata]